MLLRDVQMLRFAKQAFGTEGAAGLLTEETVIKGISRESLLTEMEYWKGLYSNSVKTKGGSQGGFRALCTAALEPEDVISVTANIPAMADNYINTDTNRVQCNTRPAAGEALKYVETSFLASRITAPVTITAGLNDKTCAPVGVMCIWNSIKAAHADDANYEASITFIQSRTHSYIPEYAENQTQTIDMKYDPGENSNPETDPEPEEFPVPPAGIANTRANYTKSEYATATQAF